MIVLNKRTVYVKYVNKPHFTDNPFEMGQNLLYMLLRQMVLRRHVTKITIEANELTKIDYVILPGRWIDRLYDNGMLRRGTL